MSIVVASGSHCNTTDHDDESGTTNGLPREGEDMLDEGNAARKKSTVRKKRGDGFRRDSDDEVANGEGIGSVYSVEPDRRAGRCIPDQAWARLQTHRKQYSTARCECARYDRVSAHSAILWRLSQAWCCVWV